MGVLLSVHPHVHGELSVSAARSWSGVGSSPRAWGTLPFFRLVLRSSRFIPTCMGNSPTRPARRRGPPVHPHVHGELSVLRVSPWGDCGSSPRAWGTRRREVYIDARDRFIPRHGELVTKALPVALLRLIPTCMGNSSSDRERPGACGSSPCMGNSADTHHRARSVPVHPHVHGELRNSWFPLPGYLGSSPRAWGTLYLVWRGLWQNRFIPTCMGNSPL